MEEQTIKTTLPALHQFLSETPLTPAIWSQIHSDLSDLNWLSPPEDPSTLIQSLFSHIERLCSSLPSGEFYPTLKLNRVKLFIYDFLFASIGNKEKCKELCVLFKKSLKDLSFFKSSEAAIDKAEEDLPAVLLQVEKQLKNIKDYLKETFILLGKPLQDEYDKDLTETVDEAFFSEVLETHKTKLKGSEESKRVFKDYKPNVYFSSSRYSNSIYNTYHKIENVYVGQMTSDRKRNGYGKMYFSNLNYYEGFWENDRPEGQGMCVWKDGGKYAGEFKAGKLEGIGKRVYSNGSHYEGEFNNSKRKGKGKMRFKNGDFYEGEWSSDEMSGKGVYVWGSGDTYIGEFSRDKKEGKGTLTLSTGEVYSGTWSSGVYKSDLSS